MSFLNFNFEERLQESLDAMGFETPTPVQEQAIPIILKGKDLIACAQTGTGKTAAFLLPVLNDLCKNPSENITTLVIVPTRELALQIDNAIQGLSYFTGSSSIAIFGGGDGQVFAREKKALIEGANIIVATPGRLMAHLNMGYVPMKDLKHLILDEADRMLDMGFVDDILRIVSYLPAKRQTLMFSATMPEKIRNLAKKLLQSPEEVSLSVSKPAEGVTQLVYPVYDNQKLRLIKHLLSKGSYGSVIVFTSTKSSAKDLYRELRSKLNVEAIHSDLEQNEREEVLLNFRNRKTEILVATDILSRGIDIEDIGLVINYDVPHDAEDYVHRVGRTARAATTGVAITFVSPESFRKFNKIETFIGYEIPKEPLPDFLGEAPEYKILPAQKPKNDRKRKPFKGKRDHSHRNGKPKLNTGDPTIKNKDK